MGGDKKLVHKKMRFAARVKCSKGIICSSQPGPYIILCNVGQGTGLEKQTILSLVEKLDGIKLLKFIPEKGETYSFLEFKNTDDAKLFYETYDGKIKADDKGTPIYMWYVENVPNTERILSDEVPEGLLMIANFITEEEEKQFIQLFDWVDESNLKNRQVKHYGYEFRYGTNDVDLDAPLEQKIPDACNVLWERLKQNGVEFEIPDQMTVNKYSPGQGIPSHVDRHSPFGSTILSLSLGSSVVMDWTHHSNLYVPVEVPARSLLVMQGAARYDWQHGIQPRTWDPLIEERTHRGEPVRVMTHDTVARGTRISLTFRKTREGECSCGYEALCDRARMWKNVEEKLVSDLEELHVHQVYEQIAGHFSITRHKPWPKVVEFLRDVPPGSVLLDLGAGNGKNVLPRGDIVQIAGERSSGLLAECQRHTRDVAGADCVRLDLLRAGLKDQCADVVICIAVVHHFGSLKRRLDAIRTIARVLRSGGRALITVWAKDQTKSNYLCREKEANSKLVSTVGGLNLPIHENRTQFEHNDLLVPWKLKVGNKVTSRPEDTLLRYYHVFEEGELDSLCALPELKVENSFYEQGNWCVICKKI